MSLLDQLGSAQNGAFFTLAASAAGIDAITAKTAIGQLAPTIAQRLRDKAAADGDAFEALLDLLEDGDGSDLSDPSSLTDSEAISDGNAILDDVFGSAAAARKALAPLVPGLDSGAAAKLSAISATGVLAALAASSANTLMSEPQQAASDGGSGGGGLMSVVVGALVKGLMQGASRQLAPKRRRRRSYAGYYTRRRPARRKRKRSVGLDDLFKGILGGR